MGITLSKDMLVEVGEEYIFYDLAMFSCTLGEVIDKLKKYDNSETYGYNVTTVGPSQVKLFSYKDGLIYPYDFYHDVDNFNELPKMIDSDNIHGLKYEKQWCVGEYCNFIGAPEKAEILMKAKKGNK